MPKRHELAMLALVTAVQRAGRDQEENDEADDWDARRDGDQPEDPEDVDDEGDEKDDQPGGDGARFRIAAKAGPEGIWIMARARSAALNRKKSATAGRSPRPPASARGAATTTAIRVQRSTLSPVSEKTRASRLTVTRRTPIRFKRGRRPAS
jgi:hypothetical protein